MHLQSNFISSHGLQTPMIPDKHVYGPLKNLMLVHVADPRVCSKNEGPAVEFLMALCVKLGQFPGFVAPSYSHDTSVTR